MIRDNDPVTNRFISVPRDYAPLNCASYMGGIVRGALDAADFVRDWPHRRSRTATFLPLCLTSVRLLALPPFASVRVSVIVRLHSPVQ